MKYLTIDCKDHELQSKLNDWAKDGYRFLALSTYTSGFHTYVIAVMSKEG